MKTYAPSRQRSDAKTDAAHSTHSVRSNRISVEPRRRSTLVEPVELVQAKLSLNEPRDRYEIEADRMADQVVAGPALGVERVPAPTKAKPISTIPNRLNRQADRQVEEPLLRQAEGEEEEEAQARFEALQRQEEENEEEEEEVQTKRDRLQRQADEGEEEEEEVQTRRDNLQRQTEEGEEEEEEEAATLAQTKADSGVKRTVDHGIERNIRSERSGGRPLDKSTRRFMEARFGVDLGAVRIHDDHTASRLTRKLHAQAFTVGHDIFFRHGRYETRTRNGRHLLAHELTHVVQQRRGEVRRKTAAPEAPAVESGGGELTRTPVEPSMTRVSVEERTTPSPKSDSAPVREEPAAGAPPAEGVPIKKEMAGGGGPAPEDIKPVEPLPLEGKSDKVMEGFLDAGASQIAASYGKLGGALDGKMAEEKQEVQEKTPPLTAQTRGTAQQIKEVSPSPKDAGTVDIKSGATGPEPPKAKAAPHRDLAAAPNNRRQADAVDKKDSGGFFSWLRDNFRKVVGGIKVKDPGVNTKAGSRPKMSTAGQADPERADKQKRDGQDKVDKKHLEAVKEISKHPGQKNIQPVKIKEDKAIQLDSKAKGEPIETQKMSDLDEFAAMPLPENVRAAADKRMDPVLKTSLAKPRQQVTESATKRETEKKEAIDKAQEETKQLNVGAEKEQTDEVLGARRKVADKQMASIKDANKQATTFSQEATEEQGKAKKATTDRIASDEKEADAKLVKAEQDAAAKKRDEERRAAQEKKRLESESKSDSWWDRAVSVVKRAVKAVTAVIDKIFTALRKAVKAIIDAAKNAAIALIEKGRQWVVNRLNEFGSWLKSKVNKYLSAFPALQRKLNKFIDGAVAVATKAVNFVADRLKKGVEALANALAGFLDKILAVFQTALKAAVQIAGALLTGDFKEAAKIAFLATCEILGINPQPVLDFINKARDQIVWIFKNPGKFFSNVAAGVKKGIQQFGSNIKKHLIGGLVSWLTGALSGVQITLPKKWDARGFFSLVMQILGLTYDNIRRRVVKKLGPKGEKIISTIEKTVVFVKELITRGPIVLWEKVKKSLADIKQRIVGEIVKWVSITVIKEGIIWLISLLNPATAILKAVKLLFDLVIWLVNNFQRIVDFIKSIYDSISELAAGKIDKAANYIEATLARTIPIVISFLASLLGLGSIGKTVQKIMRTIQKPINKALDKVIGWLVKIGRKLLKGGKSLLKKGKEKVKAAAAKVVQWWKKKLSFKSADGKGHEMYLKGRTASAQVMIKSQAVTLDRVIQTKTWAGAELSNSQVGQLKRAATLAKDAVGRLAAAEKKKPRPKTEIAKEQANITSAYKIVETVLGAVVQSDLHGPKGTSDDPVLINWYKTADDYATVHEGSVAWTIKKAASGGWPGGKIQPDLGKNLKKKGEVWPKPASEDSGGGAASRLNRYLQEQRDAKPPGLVISQGGVSGLKSKKDVTEESYEIDHVRDLGLGGEDERDNVWPLLTAKNQAATVNGRQKINYRGKSMSLYKLAAMDLPDVRVKVVGTKSPPPGEDYSGPVEIQWFKNVSDYPKVDGKSITQGVTVLGTSYVPSAKHYSPLGEEWPLKRNSNRSKANYFREKLKKARQEDKGGVVSNESGPIEGPPPSGLYQVEHIFDLKWGGKDSTRNIWPIRADKNNAANAVNLQYVRLGDTTKPVRNLKELAGKHVKVVDVRSIPGSSGGHGTTQDNPAGAALLKKLEEKKK